MKQTELVISFDGEKLSALKRYMGKKDLSLETELGDTLHKFYEKFVPAPVREYIEENDFIQQPTRETRQRKASKNTSSESSSKPEVLE